MCVNESTSHAVPIGDCAHGERTGNMWEVLRQIKRLGAGRPSRDREDGSGPGEVAASSQQLDLAGRLPGGPSSPNCQLPCCKSGLGLKSSLYTCQRT